MLAKSLLAFAVLPAALAATTSYSSWTETEEKCTTKYATVKPYSVKSTLSTKTVHSRPVKVTSVSRPIVTITKRPVKEVVTEVSTDIETTTDSTITDTFSTTSTYYETATEYSTTTFAETETEYETTTSTSTILDPPAPASFYPVQDTTASVYPGAPQAQKLKLRGQTLPKAQSCSKAKFPKAINCVEYVEVKTIATIIKKGIPTTTRVPAPVQTITKTETTTSTSTVVPDDVTVTESYSATETDTTTEWSSETTTATITVTLEATTTTAIAEACQATNFLSQGKGGDIENMFHLGRSGDYWSSIPTDNTYDCCKACINDATCMYGGWNTLDGSCYLARRSTCPGQGDYPGYYVEYSTDSGFRLEVFNGYCGFMYDAGTPY